MKVLITDANILIDLLKTEVIGRFFRLKYEIHTTHAVIEECNEDQQKLLNKHINSGKLSILPMNTEDDDLVESLLGENPGLSHADCTVLHAAKSLQAILLTGDRKLRMVTLDSKLEVRGIFWVFDEMLKQKVMEKKEYTQKLSKLKEINRWLPEDEFKKRNIL
jgi:predicted nucleic acid-binding protein